METRQAKTSRPQLTAAELEIMQERYEEQQIVLARQKEAFASEREKFNKEKDRILNEKNEELQRCGRELEASHHALSELREEIRQRDNDLRRCEDQDTQNATEYENRDEIRRDVENLRREVTALRLANPVPGLDTNQDQRSSYPNRPHPLPRLLICPMTTQDQGYRSAKP